MKKIVSVSLACVLLLGCILAFSSCSMISGTYVSSFDDDYSVSFVANYMVTTRELDDGAKYMQVYKYKIDDDEIEMTALFAASTSKDEDVIEEVLDTNEEIKENDEEDNTMTLYFEKDDGVIIIGGVTFEKE